MISLRLAGYQPWHSAVRIGDAPADVNAQLKREDANENTPAPTAAAPSLGELARQARAKKGAQDGQKPAGDAAGQDAKPTPITLEN